jgi:hypothetical protein
MLWLGVLFVLSIYFFPTGIVGKLRGRLARPRATRERSIVIVLLV